MLWAASSTALPFARSTAASGRKSDRLDPLLERGRRRRQPHDWRQHIGSVERMVSQFQTRGSEGKRKERWQHNAVMESSLNDSPLLHGGINMLRQAKLQLQTLVWGPGGAPNPSVLSVIMTMSQLHDAEIRANSCLILDCLTSAQVCFGRIMKKSLTASWQVVSKTHHEAMSCLDY